MRRTPSKAKIGGKKDATVANIEKMERQREERRRAMAEFKKEREAEQLYNEKMGRPGDVDFQRMVDNWRRANCREAEHRINSKKICICVRKRPVSEKEVASKDFDTVTLLNPKVIVHFPKLKIDGITKFLDNQDFRFDHSFSERSSTEDVYENAASPLVDFAVQGGRATVFAYGQTGSGKTHTMSGIMKLAAAEVFDSLAKAGAARAGFAVNCSMFEIYGGRCQDLLAQRKRLNVREDGAGEVQVAGLEEFKCTTVDDMLRLVDAGNGERTTHVTEMNDTSSRSHAIFQVTIRDGRGKLHGKLSLIDLAGSERGADTKSHNRQRRLESAEINKSLLALKECMRALDGASSHVPYRASKLTLILKDSFTVATARCVMLACVSPAASSSDHTVNTLRYADRIKEKNADAPVLEAMRVVEGVPERFAKKQSPGTAAAGKGGSPGALAAGAGSPGAKGGAGSPGVPPPPAGAPPPPPDMPPPPPAHPPPPPPSSTAAAGGSGPGKENARSRRTSKLGTSSSSSSSSRTPPGDFVSVREAQVSPAPASKLQRGVSDAQREDIQYLQRSLRDQATAAGNGGAPAGQTDDSLEATTSLWEAGQSLYEQEEALLNAHMNAIQENAELLTEEGQLLARVQGEDVVDYDIDAYASRLDEILARKVGMIQELRQQLSAFRQNLKEEEAASSRVTKVPLY